ncbi:MAG TPA: CHAD domain-containing protein, partial [Phenylobacterium sp.]
RRWEKLRARGEDLADADDAARHDLRIDAKKLRYAAEGFQALYPAQRTQRFISRLKALQTALGRLNDVAVAPQLLQGFALEGRAVFAAGYLSGELAAAKPQRIDDAAKAYRKLAQTDAFWD